MKERDYYFDNLKGFLIFTVVIGHIFEEISANTLDTEFLVFVIYLFHMPLFTFVSGYFCKMSKRSTQDKVKEMLKIYVISQIAYTLFYGLILGTPNTELKILYPNWTLWYLLSLVFWYIISDYIKEPKKWLIGTVLLSLVIGLDTTIGGFFSISRTLFFLPFFVAGYTVDKSIIDKVKNFKWQVIAANLVILAITYVYYQTIPVEALYEYCDYQWYFDDSTIGMVARAFHYIAAFITGALVMSLTCKAKTFWAYWGRNSLVAYLIHAGLIKIVSDFKIVNVYDFNSAIIYIIVVLALVAGITYGYVTIVSKIKLRNLQQKEVIES